MSTRIKSMLSELPAEIKTIETEAFFRFDCNRGIKIP